MNELDLLTQLRDEVPLTDPSPAFEHAVLASFLAEGRPASSARHRRFDGENRAARISPRPPRPALRRRVVVAGIAAVALAAAAILASGLSRGPGPAPSRPAAGPEPTRPAAVPTQPAQESLGRARTEAQLVDYATRAAAAAPDVLPGPHEWIYVKTEVAASSAGGGGFLFGPPNERVIGRDWTRVDQGMFADYSHGHLQFSPGGMPATLGGWKSISPSYLNSLPSGPAQLEAAIRASNPDYDRNYAIFNAIFTLMSDGQFEGTWIPPKLEVAMYRVLASLPGVHFDATTDLAGRQGMGFYMLQGGWEKQELVINPVTYAYMGFEWVAVRAHTAVGTDGTRHMGKGQVLGWGALLDIAVVQQAGELP